MAKAQPAQMDSFQKEKHIVRIQNAHNAGWQLRLPVYVVLEGAGAPRSVYFSDQKFGGTQHALAAAIQERDRLVLESTGLASQRIAKFQDAPGGRNQTGIVGVHFKELQRGARWQLICVTTWREDQKRFKHKEFRVRVLGLTGAVQQAVALRRELHPAQLITDEQVTKAIQFGAQVLEQNAWRTGGEASPMHA